MPKLSTIFDWGLIVQIIRSEQFLLCTQEQLANRLGVCTSTISNWESKISEPHTSHKRNIRDLAVKAGFDVSLWPKNEKDRPYLISKSEPGV